MLPDVRSLQRVPDTGVHRLNVDNSREGARKAERPAASKMESEGKSVNVAQFKDTNGRPPLYLAALNGKLRAAQRLIERGAILDLRVTGNDDSSGRTAAHAAAESGHLDVMDLLISEGANINVQDEEGRTPLHLAVAYRQLAMTEFLLSKGSNPQTLNKSGNSPLHSLFSLAKKPDERELGLFKLLLPVSNLDKPDSAGLYSIHYAAYWDGLPPVRRAMTSRKHLNVEDSDGRTPLHYCFMNKWKVGMKTAKYLISRGAKAYVKDKNGDTATHVMLKRKDAQRTRIRAFVRDFLSVHVHDDLGKSLLHLSVMDGSLPVVEYLLKCGVDINLQDPGGFCALHLAALGGQVHVLKFLLEQGAQVNLENNQKHSTLHFAAVLKSEVCAKQLVEAGADVEVRNELGMTPLHKAAGWGSLEILKVLIASGADVAAADKDLHQPIHLAANEGQASHVEVLILKGSNLNSKDKENRTPLHLAAKSGHTDTVKTLIVHGGLVNSVDSHGQTPLHLAGAFGKTETVQALLNREADVTWPDKEGRTAQEVAQDFGYRDVVNAIVSHNESLVVYSPGGAAKLASLRSKAGTLPNDGPLVTNRQSNFWGSLTGRQKTGTGHYSLIGESESSSSNRRFCVMM